jgi:ankyrin repeat protein
MGLFLMRKIKDLKIRGYWTGSFCWLALLLLLSACRSHNAALLDAVERQEVGNVKRLLESGAKPDEVPEDGKMYPIEAAAKGGNPAIVKMLLEAGAKPNAAKGDKSPLWWAMLNGHEEAAVLLIDAKAKFDGPMLNGISPFYFAVMQDYTDLVSKMIAFGVDVDAPGPQGTPLHEAAENGNLPLVRLLVATGAEPNRINDLGESAIFLAVAKGNWEIVEWMTSNGANINATNNLGQTVLHQCAEKADSMAIIRLCVLKADPDKQNFLGESPLHVAAGKGNLPAARALIEDCHADLNTRDHHDLSPAGLAYREGQSPMVEFLTQRGGRLR